jgi:tetratricopeptide (TPR) repeat protein
MSTRFVSLFLSAWTLATSVPGVALAEAKMADEQRVEQAEAAASNPGTSLMPLTVALPGPPMDNGHVDLEKIGRERMVRMFSNRVNSRIGRYLNAAMESQDEDPEEGLLLIAKLNPKRLNAMERASVFRIEAMLNYAMGDMDATIEGFRKVLDEEIMPVRQDIALRFNVAQLLAGLYRWDDAIVALNDWFRWTPVPDPAAFYLLGIANYQLGNSALAIVNTQMALELADEPKEGWLQLLAALFIQSGDYANATPVFERLVVLFPKKSYWVQLALIYGARDDYRASLAVQQVAYAQGFLTNDKELRRLARSYLYADLPHPAAVILEKGLAEGAIEEKVRSLEMLANSWIAAREFEKSLPPLKLAAKVAENGNLYVRLGQVYLQREEWSLAAAGFEDALDKGDLKRPGNALLLRGIAYYNDNQSFRAKSSFIEATGHEKTQNEAEQWLDHLEREAKTS